MSAPFPRQRLRAGVARSGFTLVELLTVMAIMAILLYLAIPASTSLQETNNLGFGGQSVVDELAVARQYAASRNQTVYVRFIAPSASSYQGYSFVQIWTTNPATGTQVPVDHIVKLPVGIEVSAISALSPLVSTGNNGLAGNTSPMPSGSTIAGSYVYFTVRPDGNVVVPAPPSQVNVNTATNAAYQFQPYYFLTLVPVRDDNNTALPKNYVTIEVNPDTANTQIFRP
jgi:uncharacterized protein (TIGR02596 family)